MSQTLKESQRGLTDRARRPPRHANQLPMAVEKLIVRLKKEYPDSH
jgi:putative transposase